MSPEDLIKQIEQLKRNAEALFPNIKANPAQSALLVRRLAAIAHDIDTQKTNLSTQANLKNLQCLHEAFGEALRLFEKFSGRDWSRHLLQNGSHQQVFTEINQKLHTTLNNLKLSTLAASMIDGRENAAAHEKDTQALALQKNEISAHYQQVHLQTQRLNFDEAERAALLQQQEESSKDKLTELSRAGTSAASSGAGAGAAAAARAELIPAHLTVNYYDLDFDEKLAEGTFGHVYSGRWQEQEVAIKSIEGLISDRDREEFIREVKIMSRLRAPHIVQFYVACIEKKRMCLVMEYMPAGSLYEVLHKKPDQWILWAQRFKVALDLSRGLFYLHSQGVLHRDFKSGNVLLDEAHRAKISDFGLSRIDSSSVMTIRESSKALQWLPPEMHERGQSYTEASDVYSLGVILWELFTGKLPFEGVSDAEILRRIASGDRDLMTNQVPAGIRKIIDECCQVIVSSRPDAFEVIRDIEENGLQNTTDGQADYEIGLAHEAAEEMPEALASYQKASDQGYYRAKTNMATFFYHATGVPADKQKAHDLWLDAAQNSGHARAEYNLGVMLETGDGVPKDLEAAIHWYRDAAAQGDPNAEEKLQTLTMG